MNKLSPRSVRNLAKDLRRLLPIRRVRDERAPALSPDILVHVGEQKTESMALQVVDYDAGEIRELSSPSVEECVAFETKETPTWIRVTGLHEVDKIAALLEACGIHPLVQSEIVNTRQLPKVESFDDLLMEDNQALDPGQLHTLKRQVAYLHPTIRPAREVVSGLARGDSDFVEEGTLIFFRDLYDHVTHAIEITDQLREGASSLRDFYLAAVSNRMNEVMKVLILFATFFMPITFLAGIYGMNFTHMPELGWKWAYPALWGVFLLLAIGMFLFFRRRNWL